MLTGVTYVFLEIEKQKVQIPKSSRVVSTLFTAEGNIQVDFRWASNALWTFIGKHVTDTIYTNRSTLCGGGENGIELWRALYVKHEGGADQVEIGGIGSLHTFPQCDMIEHLQHLIDKWQETEDLYDAGLTDPHLKSMFLNIMPPTVAKEVRENKTLNTLQECINHVVSEFGRLNDVKRSQLHSDRLKRSPSSTKRLNVVTERTEEEEKVETSRAKDQSKSIVNQLTNKIDTIAAAVNTTRTQPKDGPRQQQEQQQQQRGPFDLKIQKLFALRLKDA